MFKTVVQEVNTALGTPLVDGRGGTGVGDPPGPRGGRAGAIAGMMAPGTERLR